MQTSNPGFGQSKTFSNLTQTKKTIKHIWTLPNWPAELFAVVEEISWNAKTYPTCPTHPTDGESPIDCSTAELVWSWALLKFHLNNYNWKITAHRTCTFPRARAWTPTEDKSNNWNIVHIKKRSRIGWEWQCLACTHLRACFTGANLFLTANN